MAKPNFSFQKRQREQERARKKQEKAQRKLERANNPDGTDPDLEGIVPREDGADDAPAPETPAP